MVDDAWNFDYMNRRYGTSWAKGDRVIYDGKPGVVTGATEHVKVRLGDARHSVPVHPTDKALVREDSP